MKAKFVFTEEKGGPGSGHHGHSGRPGKVGGSSGGTSSYGTEQNLPKINSTEIETRIGNMPKEYRRFNNEQRMVDSVSKIYSRYATNDKPVVSNLLSVSENLLDKIAEHTGLIENVGDVKTASGNIFAGYVPTHYIES